jgi:hypothetical protein
MDWAMCASLEFFVQKKKDPIFVHVLPGGLPSAQSPHTPKLTENT